MKTYIPLKRQVILFITVVIFILVTPLVQAGTMHSVGGTVKYSDNSSPSTVTFTAYILGRSGEILTQSSPGCNYVIYFGTGYYQVQVGSFPTDWIAGDILHVDLSDGLGGNVSGEVTLTNAPGEALDLVISSAVTNTTPIVSDIPGQTLPEGSSFATINLDDYVSDNETSDANIAWTFSGNSSLSVSIVNRVATITTPGNEWNGSETITFIATDDDATDPLSDSDDATFAVTAVNDPPSITGQVTLTTTEDTPLTLAAANFTI
ncbi:MAG: hypothetical protein JW830_07075, partial [Bacteroidales bacterium]|nr:hypothetical protein [Bacteroidales bacterium]